MYLYIPKRCFSDSQQYKLSLSAGMLSVLSPEEGWCGKVLWEGSEAFGAAVRAGCCRWQSGSARQAEAKQESGAKGQLWVQNNEELGVVDDCFRRID